ncbi:MAG: VanZ family protein [Prevotellaceae bacterium]|nr:VanZ family protein [Prevotellaceae bacterium]
MKSFLIKNKFTAVACLVVLILSVMSGNSLPKSAIPNIDKIVHILMYFGIGAAMFLDYFLKNKTFALWKNKLLMFVLFPFLFGLAIEIIQGFLPYRTAEWLDLLSDFLGGILAILVVLCFGKKIENIIKKSTDYTN